MFIRYAGGERTDYSILRMFVRTTKLALNPGCHEKADYSLRPEGAIRDFWRAISETRNSPQGIVVPAARIDLTALTALGGPGCLGAWPRDDLFDQSRRVARKSESRPRYHTKPAQLSGFRGF